MWNCCVWLPRLIIASYWRRLLILPSTTRNHACYDHRLGHQTRLSSWSSDLHESDRILSFVGVPCHCIRLEDWSRDTLCFILWDAWFPGMRRFFFLLFLFVFVAVMFSRGASTQTVSHGLVLICIYLCVSLFKVIFLRFPVRSLTYIKAEENSCKSASNLGTMLQ